MLLPEQYIYVYFRLWKLSRLPTRLGTTIVKFHLSQFGPTRVDVHLLDLGSCQGNAFTNLYGHENINRDVDRPPQVKYQGT
jgi:hypothetical protein